MTTGRAAGSIWDNVAGTGPSGLPKFRDTITGVKQQLKPGENDLTFDLAK
ncbi:hypothetical protein [Urbifossiella limnaea]|nr:hypothetical protein [Urbifossiella limnaea]